MTSDTSVQDPVAQEFSVHDLASLEQGILRSRRISHNDVMSLRRLLYRDGQIKDAEANLIFRLDQACDGADRSWDELYVQALTDFFFWHRGSECTLSDADGDKLIDWISADDKVAEQRELKLLVNIMARTQGSPDRLKKFAIEAVRESVLNSGERLFGDEERVAGAIDEDDVVILRRVLYGFGSESGLAISRGEAELLLELNRLTSGKHNAATWQPLFVKAVTMYLLHQGDSPERVDEAEAQWLLERISASGQLNENERALLDYLVREATHIHPSLTGLRPIPADAPAII